jgi:multisubunit Na+/H+ antiporter MnhB subunit
MKALKILSGFGLTAVSSLAFAASNMPILSIEGVVEFGLVLIVLAIIFGILWLLIDKAPIVNPEVKVWVKYVILFLAAVAVIFMLLRLIGHPLFGM